MTIHPVSSNSNKVSLPSKSTPSEPAKNTDKLAVEKRSDELDITAVAKEITNAFKSSTTSSPIDHERVNAVKEALAGKTYQIDPEEIAKKMMQLEQNSPPNSR